ncbi:MAG: DUF3127 domain-containing protein [Bacteroidetes bacterium]|nr:DUF3127 domain-containing protein [Bacteroidota bacterium]MBS1740063.1 DUF3127 domain-containing protein [Bacteroidota bacterium]
MSLEITGKLVVKYDTQQIKDTFKKREFVLDISEEVNGTVYNNYAKMQLTQAKCETLDTFNEGDILKVTFNIRGNRWEKDGKVNYITSLDAWRVEKAGEPAQPVQRNPAYMNTPSFPPTSNTTPAGFSAAPAEGGDDLPF